ncbi:ABC transporter permease [uncultured Eubacterium sp.]|uniref:ABC transporter permease n=1 Tax=uncultured Eubacterium sp. TaxID=165185 RepID=UPI00258A2056|nr:FtsX-like permease family protein [uncultured Eubacterium sp.]
MNIVNKLTLRHLKENKDRTLVTTFGIIVSVAMITAVFVAMASFLQLFADVSVVSDGNYAAQLSDVKLSSLDELYKDERIETVGLCDENYKQFKIDNGKSDRLATGSIGACDDGYFKMFIQADYDGTLPKTSDEIAVQSDFIEKNELDWQVGDIVSIPCGIRTMRDKDGEFDVKGAYSKGEKFVRQEVKQYRITAILHQNNPTSEFEFLTYSDDLKANPTVAFQLKTLNSKSLDVVNDIIDKANPGTSTVNNELLYSKLSFSSDSFVANILPLVVILLIIIMVASVVLIYNAFAMSLSEKVKYLGMLSSVGATKQQKRLSIYYEGFILALFGIPLGIGAGVAGIGITLKALGKKIIATSMINGVTEQNVSMKVVFPIWAVLIVLGLSIITILISCSIPAKKASKISTISAIRQSDEIKVKAKTLKCPKYIKAIFGYEGELAYKNLKRNGRKARVITVSIALSIVLFLSCNYFCALFANETVAQDSMPYQIGVYLDETNRESAIKEFENVDGIDDMYSVTNLYYFVQKSKNYKNNFEMFTDNKNLTNAYSREFSNRFAVLINMLDDDMFNELCAKNGIDSKAYYNSNNKCKLLLMNNVSHTANGKKVFTDNILGSSFKEAYYPEDNLQFEITDFVKYSNTKPCNLNNIGVISLYMPYSQFVKVCKNINANDNQLSKYILGIETTDHQKVTEKLNTISDDGKYSNFSVVDFSEQMQAFNTIALVIQVFVYGFVALISLITIFNIINTISSGIASRKKEFAMMKSVGITPKGFNKMIMLESAFYGIKAVIFGLPISALISFGMHKALNNSTTTFSIDYVLYLIVALVVFAIIGMTMIYSVKKVQQNNIIETLKDDIN